jgi:hypothetical protein
MGSQSWGERQNDFDSGPSSFGLGHTLVPLSIFSACWWFAFSQSSPIKECFWWQMFFFFIAPPLLTVSLAVLFR